MCPINIKKDFITINLALLTISDSRTLKNDTSGSLLENKIKKLGHNLYDRKIIKDEIHLIKQTILSWSSNPKIDVIISSGGTGLTGRDSTPEAIIPIADKIIEGFGELFRQISYKKIGTSTIQSRALGAVIKGTYVFSLPGSKSACKDAWDEILIYQLDNRFEPCNFIEILPRVKQV